MLVRCWDELELFLITQIYWVTTIICCTIIYTFSSDRAGDIQHKRVPSAWLPNDISYTI